jgi:hypothetical protein
MAAMAKEAAKIAAARNSNSAELTLSIEYASAHVATGEVFKQGRGRNMSMIKPWKKRHIVVDTNAGVVAYYAEPGALSL